MFGINLEGVSTSMLSNLSKLTKNEKQTLAINFMKYARDVVSEKKDGLLFSKLKFLSIKSITVFSG